MTTKRYWQATAALPIVAPLLAWPLTEPVSEAGFPFLSGILAVFAASILYGGIFYVPFAAALLWILRKREAEVYRRLSFVVPLVFAVALFLIIFIFSSVAARSTGRLLEALEFSAFFGAIAVAVGYCYVAVAHLGYWILRRRGSLTVTDDGQGEDFSGRRSRVTLP